MKILVPILHFNLCDVAQWNDIHQTWHKGRRTTNNRTIFDKEAVKIHNIPFAFVSEPNLNGRAVLQNYFLIVRVNTFDCRDSSDVCEVAYWHSIRPIYSHLLHTIHIYSSKLLPKALNWNLECSASSET